MVINLSNQRKLFRFQPVKTLTIKDYQILGCNQRIESDNDCDCLIHILFPTCAKKQHIMSSAPETLYVFTPNTNEQVRSTCHSHKPCNLLAYCIITNRSTGAIKECISNSNHSV